MPRCNSAPAIFVTRAASPSITGKIGWLPDLSLNPAFSRPTRRVWALTCSRSRRLLDVVISFSAFRPALTIGGDSELENRDAGATERLAQGRGDDVDAFEAAQRLR